jgi:hypothetical protein
MKNRFPISLITIITLLSAGCNKVPPAGKITCDSKSFPSAPPSGKAPKVFAGPDLTIGRSLGLFYLTGSYLDAGQHANATWEKIEGPQCHIENSNSLVTSVLDPSVGNYKFELTVTNDLGLSSKDTLQLIVNNSNEQSIILNKIQVMKDNSGNIIPLMLQLGPVINNNIDYVLVRYRHPDGDLSEWQIANFQIPPAINWGFELGYWYKKASANLLRIEGSLYEIGSFDIKIHY